MHRHASIATFAAAALLVPTALAQVQGPSSSAPPYILPSAPGVQTVSILTVGDTVTSGGQSYRLVGLPDGMGARPLHGHRFELVVNHEIVGSAGVVRAHGQTGAFVSRWQIRAGDLRVLSGSDLIQNVTTVSGNEQISRLCSGDLPARSAFFPFAFALHSPYLFLSGEEVGAEGRGFAHVVTGAEAGESYELPALGKLSFENLVARPMPSLRTVVVSLDDSTPGQVYVYIGWKQPFGNAVARAGLLGGSLYGVRVPGVALEDRATGIGLETRFELAGLGEVSAKTGAQIQTDSVALGVTEFLRPEDGAWDPNDPRSFYFVTTDRFQNATQVGRSRLWRLRFDSAFAPELGGTIDMLLDGTEGQQMMDNVGFDRRGHLLIQEDPGNQDYLARVWQYTLATDQLKLVAEHSAAYFAPGAANFLTRDEESSGVIDASDVLGAGWFLINCEAHYPIAGELVEGGQLLALFNPDSL